MSRYEPMFTYDELSSHAVTILDKYDFTNSLESYIAQGIHELHEVIEFLISEYGKSVEDAVDELTNDEKMEYLEDRYNIVFSEKITYEMHKK